MEVAKLILGIVFLGLSYLFDCLSLPHWTILVSLGLAYLILAYEIIITAFKNIINGEFFDENFLMTIATIGSIILKDYKEAVFVMLFYSIGEFAQDLAVDKSKDNISALMDIAPQSARIKLKNEYLNVKPEEVNLNDIIQVKPGEKVPLDGIIIQGNAYLDLSSLNGESLPVHINQNEAVLSGSIVLDSPVLIKVTSLYKDSTVSKIISLIEENQKTKGQTERFITKFAKVYTPIVCSLAFLLAVIPSLFNGLWSIWIHRALTFLVISCPCALVLSIPLSFFAGIGNAAKNGILVKGGICLEKLAKVNAFAFDKTGTITKGVFEVKEIKALNQFNQEELERILLTIESNSNHPIANSICNYLSTKKLKHIEIDCVKELPGLGLEVKMFNSSILCGNGKLLISHGFDVSKKEFEPDTIIYLAKDSLLIGIVKLGDTIKSEAKQTIMQLLNSGIKKTFMLSGDKKDSVDFVGKEVGIDEVHSNLLPNEKVNLLTKLKEKYRICYVGDGINDAPCLACADVGISMGSIGSQSAIEASDIVIMTDNLQKLPKAISISRKTLRISKQNIVLAIAVKLVCLILGALGISGMEVAVFADTGVALLAVLNSLRALRN